MSSGKCTPPHHPTYQVHFSDATIRTIVTTALPTSKIEKIEQLPSGKSFNNRIYFITLVNEHIDDLNDQHALTEAENSSQSVELVLKVSGQFFGPTKVQNEVSSLLILQQYCPLIPTPRVVAWSAKGSDLHVPSQRNRIPVKNEPIAGTQDRGWILITRRPGRLLSKDDLVGPNAGRLISELAMYVSEWRQKLPPANSMGNLRLLSRSRAVDPSITAYNPSSSSGPGSYIHGLLMTDIQPTRDLQTREAYYRHKTADQMKKLESENIFTSLREKIYSIVKSFFNDDLEKLPLFSPSLQESIRFTHYDLSPRNILVSEDNPPHISGIIDFEFAGFFPEEEEFTNTMVNSAGDWPGSSYTEFLQHLENYGESTPLQKMDKGIFEQACTLCRLSENIAPWWLREGGIKDEELNIELKKAENHVKNAIEYLQRSTKTNSSSLT